MLISRELTTEDTEERQRNNSRKTKLDFPLCSFVSSVANDEKLIRTDGCGRRILLDQATFTLEVRRQFATSPRTFW
jgi:hypothetical protein